MPTTKPKKSGPAREKPESAAFIQEPRVIVGVHRWQASSHKGLAVAHGKSRIEREVLAALGHDELPPALEPVDYVLN